MTIMRISRYRSKSWLAQVVGASALTLALALTAMPSAALAGPSADGRVVVSSSKSFNSVRDAVKQLVARNGMMIMATVNQGRMLSMTGLSLKATLFLIGNPAVGKQLFEQDHAVGLYVPLRVFVYSGADGRTYIAYEKPSAMLDQFANRKIEMVARVLDRKLAGLASMAAR